VILPKVRDPRLITHRRGGTLSDADHRLLAVWAAACDQGAGPRRPEEPELDLLECIRGV